MNDDHTHLARSTPRQIINCCQQPTYSPPYGHAIPYRLLLLQRFRLAALAVLQSPQLLLLGLPQFLQLALLLGLPL